MKSFVHALKGLSTLFRSESNARIHAAATLAVIGAGAWFGVSRIEWCLLLLACGFVVGAEALNTAVEFICDALHPEQHPMIGHAKDVAAGGVLVAALASLCVGFAVFCPRIL